MVPLENRFYLSDGAAESQLKVVENWGIADDEYSVAQGMFFVRWSILIDLNWSALWRGFASEVRNTKIYLQFKSLVEEKKLIVFKLFSTSDTA